MGNANRCYLTQRRAEEHPASGTPDSSTVDTVMA
jgi:hypothetical protein